MNCPDCSRPLAAGARKCVYCGHGTQVRTKPTMNIPKGPPSKPRRGQLPWGRILLVLLLAGAAAAALLHPELNAKLKSLLPR